MMRLVHGDRPPPPLQAHHPHPWASKGPPLRQLRRFPFALLRQRRVAPAEPTDPGAQGTPCAGEEPAVGIQGAPVAVISWLSSN